MDDVVMKEPDGPVTVTFTHDEALVLFEYLSEYSDTDSLKPKDQAEQRALWNLCCYFEKVLVEPFEPNYTELVNEARARLRDQYSPAGFPVLGTWGTEKSAPRAEGLVEGGGVNKETVQRYMAAYTNFDHATILSLLTDDVEWIVPGVFVRKGKAEFDAEIEAGDPPYPPTISIARLIEESNVVFAEGSVDAPRRDGTTLHLQYCDVFEIRDGLIRRLTSYLMPIPEGAAS